MNAQYVLVHLSSLLDRFYVLDTWWHSYMYIIMIYIIHKSKITMCKQHINLNKHLQIHHKYKSSISLFVFIKHWKDTYNQAVINLAHKSVISQNPIPTQ